MFTILLIRVNDRIINYLIDSGIIQIPENEQIETSWVPIKLLLVFLGFFEISDAKAFLNKVFYKFEWGLDRFYLNLKYFALISDIFVENFPNFKNLELFC